MERLYHLRSRVFIGKLVHHYSEVDFPFSLGILDI